MQKCGGKLGERIRLKLGLILRDGLRFISKRKLSVAWWWNCWEEAIKTQVQIPANVFFNRDFLD